MLGSFWPQGPPVISCQAVNPSRTTDRNEDKELTHTDPPPLDSGVGGLGWLGWGLGPTGLTPVRGTGHLTSYLQSDDSSAEGVCLPGQAQQRVRMMAGAGGRKASRRRHL